MALRPTVRSPLKMWISDDYSMQSQNVLYAANWVAADRGPSIVLQLMRFQCTLIWIKLAADTSTQNIIDSNNINVNVFPNPSESSFSINIQNLQATDKISLKIEDLNGSIIYQIKNEATEGSNYLLNWDAANVNYGVYFYSVNINGKIFTGKMVKI